MKNVTSCLGWEYASATIRGTNRAFCPIVTYSLRNFLNTFPLFIIEIDY